MFAFSRSPATCFASAALCVAGALAAPEAHAGSEAHVAPLFQKGQWATNYTTYDSGYAFCEAETWNRSGSTSILFDNDGDFLFWVFDKRWRFDKGESRQFDVRIGRSEWTVNATTVETGLYAIIDGDSGQDFIRAMMNQNTLVVLTTAGREVSRFSLSGSHAAILAMIDCVGSHLDVEAASDPFAGASSAPAASDPFF